jgi:hypothetical protein
MSEDDKEFLVELLVGVYLPGVLVVCFIVFVLLFL